MLGTTIIQYPRIFVKGMKFVTLALAQAYQNVLVVSLTRQH